MKALTPIRLRLPTNRVIDVLICSEEEQDHDCHTGDCGIGHAPAIHGPRPRGGDAPGGKTMTTVPGACDQPAPQATYSDGHPLDEVHYLECKMILKADRFTSLQSFHEFGTLVSHTAANSSVGFSTRGVIDRRPRIREVVFLDTVDFKLYNNAFILRRRIPFEDGFPVGEPEIVFKFRNPDLQKAAEMDVRPNIRGTYKVKFKAEALSLPDRSGGLRRLFSHNVEFGWSELPKADQMSTKTLGHIFPALRIVKRAASDRIDLVNQTIVEEVLQDLGVLDFGEGGSYPESWAAPRHFRKSVRSPAEPHEKSRVIT